MLNAPLAAELVLFAFHVTASVATPGPGAIVPRF